MNRRIGWRQARVVGFSSPMSLKVQLTHSGQEVDVPYEDAPIDCREPGVRVWFRRNGHFQTNEIERRD